MSDTGSGYNADNPWRLTSQFSLPKSESGENSRVIFSFYVQNGKCLMANFIGSVGLRGSAANMSET